MKTEQLLAIYRRLTAIGLAAGPHDDSIGNAIKRLKKHRRKHIGIWVRIILTFMGICFLATGFLCLSLTKWFWHFTPITAALSLVVVTYVLYISLSDELSFHFNRGFKGYRDDLAGLKCNPRTLEEYLRRGRALLAWDGPSAAAGDLLKAIELDPVDEDAKEGIKDLIWACIDDEIAMEVHLDGRFKSLEEKLLECVRRMEETAT